MTADMSPRDVANIAEERVIAMPQKILTKMLDISLSMRSDGASETKNDITECDIAATTRYLKKEFRDTYIQAAGKMSNELGEALVNMSQILEDIGKTMDAFKSPSDLRDIAQTVERKLEPALRSFMGELFTHVVAYEKEHSKRAQDVDSSALNEIDMISKKINFIAVNASVEAARVGDLGRGFAVIATEIRQLAQQANDVVGQLKSKLV